MSDAPVTIASEVHRYLRTGETDPQCEAWPGNFIERAQRARADLRSALIGKVASAVAGYADPSLPAMDLRMLSRTKVEPMVRGLFRGDEQAAVLALLEPSLVFLTSENIGRVLTEARWPWTAWRLANLYLRSVGAEPLGPDAPDIVGLSEETTCYVSTKYFAETNPFADFVVHEAAHVFHNCKRRTAGLAETRRREWLLDIAFGKRETFAYSCEAYSCVLERAKSAGERRALADAFAARRGFSGDDVIDPMEVIDIVREAAEARNGFRVILSRCAPERSVDGRTPAAV